MTRIRVGVLMGSKSIEREVSLNSGRTVCDHLDIAYFDAIPLFQALCGSLYVLPWSFLHRGKTNDFEHRLEKEAQKISWDDLPSLIDIMYIALHGRYGEDGCVQGFLEILGIPYVGSKVFASALGMHKGMQKHFLQSAGINVPKGIVVSATQITSEDNFFNASLINDLSFPLIVKPVGEGSSCGISKVSCATDILPALLKAAYINPHTIQDVVIEEYLIGMEFSCIVVVDQETGLFKALPPTEIVIEKGSDIFGYDQKYMPGRATKYTPARCSESQLQQIQDVCIRVCSVLNFNTIGRIDGFLLPDGSIVITDPNSFSGMSPSSYAFLQAAEIGMNHTTFINSLIMSELKQSNTYKASSNNAQEQYGMKEQKKRIAVLLGGASNEKEISLESGRNVVYKLSPHKYETVPLFVTDKLELYAIPPRLLVRNKTHEIQEELTSAMRIQWNDLPSLFDFIFIALHGGAGENGCIQGALEVLGLPYNGSSVLASALCRDKYRANEFLATKGFDIPKHWLIQKNNWLEELEQLISTLTFPVIVKPHDDGCSVMVHKINSLTELKEACNILFKAGKSAALIEEFIEGTELTVGVIGNNKPQALVPSQTIAAKDILSIEEKFLPGAGENQTPALLPLTALSFVQKTIEQLYETVGCAGYARIDCFYQSPQQSPHGKERLVILEINTLPGLTPATCLFHQAAEIGIKPMDFIDLIVQLGFEKHGTYSTINDTVEIMQTDISKILKKENLQK